MTKKKLKAIYKKLDSIEAYAQSAVEMLLMQMDLELAKHPRKGELHIKLSSDTKDSK